MIKRPAFFTFLVIAYLIYSISGLIQVFLSGSLAYDASSIEALAKISTNYFTYFWGIFIFAISLMMFYYLLALRIHGWILQLSFSLFFIVASFQILIIDTTLYNNMPLGNMPKFIVILWIFFNAYIVYYFLTPEVRELFFKPELKNKIKNEELISFLHITDRLKTAHKTGQLRDNADNQDFYIVPDLKDSINKKQSLKRIDYLPTARVLITPPKGIQNLNKINELERLINRKARDIIRMLGSILQSLKNKDVISDEAYSYYKTYSWDTEDIIKDFKMRAAIYCEDRRNFSDKLFKYSKKVSEVELLEKTYTQMDSWLNETGNEIGSLIDLTTN
jgi:hypothetical protein